MRQRFEQQTKLGITPISEIKFPLRSRDELPPVLKALQYIYVTRELNEKIFTLLEKKVCTGKKKTGRPGMDLWHIYQSNLSFGEINNGHLKSKNLSEE